LSCLARSGFFGRRPRRVERQVRATDKRGKIFVTRNRRPLVWMVMSTVHLPEELVDRLAVEAARRGLSVDALAAETLAAAFDQPVTPKGPRRA
jgi:hypothetical protein